jgi:hypothetical protein
MKNARSEDMEDMKDINEQQTLIASWNNGMLSSVS